MKSNDSIEIYYRYLEKDGFEYLEFKGVTHIKSILTALTAVIRDVKNMNKWVYNVDSAKSDIISDTERYTYIIHKSIGFLFQQRDSYVHSFISQDDISLEVVIKGSSTPNKIPEKDGFVRIEKGESKWKFVPITKSITKVIFQGYANPGGVIKSSLWASLAKSELWKLPYYSLNGLRNRVKMDDYEKITYSFIKNLD